MTLPTQPEPDLVSMVRFHAEKKPNEIVYTYLVDGEDTTVKITYSELDKKARAFAAQLQRFSKPGDRAILLYPSGLEFIVAFLGCLYAGVIAIPATIPHLRRDTPRLTRIFQDAKAGIACTIKEMYQRIQTALSEESQQERTDWIVNEDIPDTLSDTWVQPKIEPEDIAFLQYTSGSTSAPKGVMISRYNLTQTLVDIITGGSLNEETVIVTWLPIFHDMGLIVGLLAPVYRGFPCYVMSPVTFLEKPVRWLKAITRYKATLTVAPNFAFDFCVNKISDDEKQDLDLGSIKIVINAAEPVRMETMRSFAHSFENRGFNYEAFCPSYGLAESTVMVSAKRIQEAPPYCILDVEELKNNKLVFLPPDDPGGYILPGCGKSYIGANIKIVDPATRKLCDQDEVGEIWINSKSVAKGYWQNPQATFETFQARIENYEGGPFLRTGDLGFIYQENLYITGRIKDMVIIQGKNFYPQDIEITTEKSHPAIQPGSGAAFSIDDGTNEKLVIVYEVKRQFRKHENLDQIANSVRMEVAKHHGMRVHVICLIRPSSIEKTTSGKIQRNAARESFLINELQILYEWRAPAV